MTSKRPPSDAALGLPRVDDVEPDPDVDTGPGDDALGLPAAGDVAHRPSLAGIEHLVDPTKPHPARVHNPPAQS